MHILLIYAGGQQRHGLLLRGTPDQLRVMMPGHADAIELRRMDGLWMSESGASIEIGGVGAIASNRPAIELSAAA